MTDKTQRDFALAETSEQDWTEVSTWARTFSSVLGDGQHKARCVKLDRVKGIVTRFREYVFGLQPFALEYREDMSETELRTWAADVVKALRG